MPKTVQASDEEQALVTEILAAAAADDWERFKALSDKPFVNEASMHEQFDKSRLSMDLDRFDIETAIRVVVMPDGGKTINVDVPTLAGKDIMLFLSGVRQQGQQLHQIISFIQIPTLPWETDPPAETSARQMLDLSADPGLAGKFQSMAPAELLAFSKEQLTAYAPKGDRTALAPALQTVQVAIEQLDPRQDVLLWADCQSHLAILWGLASSADGFPTDPEREKKSNTAHGAALDAYARSLSDMDRERTPELWARTQEKLAGEQEAIAMATDDEAARSERFDAAATALDAAEAIWRGRDNQAWIANRLSKAALLESRAAGRDVDLLQAAIDGLGELLAAIDRERGQNGRNAALYMRGRLQVDLADLIGDAAMDEAGYRAMAEATGTLNEPE